MQATTFENGEIIVNIMENKVFRFDEILDGPMVDDNPLNYRSANYNERGLLAYTGENSMELPLPDPSFEELNPSMFAVKKDQVKLVSEIPATKRNLEIGDLKNPFDIIGRLRKDATKSCNGMFGSETSAGVDAYVQGFLMSKFAMAIKKGKLSYEDLQ